jgi:hypothetical protein
MSNISAKRLLVVLFGTPPEEVNLLRLVSARIACVRSSRTGKKWRET